MRMMRGTSIRGAPAPRCSSSVATAAARSASRARPLARRDAPALASRAAAVKQVAARAAAVVVQASQYDTTVSDTKRNFLELYPSPVPAMYSTVIQELLVQHHLVKFGTKFVYDKVYALGFTSVYDGIMDQFPGDKDGIFAAYLGALKEDAAATRKDAEDMAAMAESLGTGASVDALFPDASGSGIQQESASMASAFADGSKGYNKFVAIGMFRLLELTGNTDPASLESLTSALNVPLSKVTGDLATYKALLSKITKARELMAEIVAEQKKKAAQRAEEKAARDQGVQASASSGGEGSGPAPSAA